MERQDKDELHELLNELACSNSYDEKIHDAVEIIKDYIGNQMSEHPPEPYTNPCYPSCNHGDGSDWCGSKTIDDHYCFTRCPANPGNYKNRI